MKFGIGMDLDAISVDLEGQGHSSKGKVTMVKTLHDPRPKFTRPKSSVCNTSVQKNPRPKFMKVKGHGGHGKLRVPNKGRWAHINVKLLHFLIG